VTGKTTIDAIQDRIPENYRQHLKKIWPLAEKMAREYYPFVPKEIANSNSEKSQEQNAYRVFLAEVYQIAFLALARAKKTYDRKKGASFNSWVYFYLRQAMNETFTENNYFYIHSLPIRPDCKKDLISILKLRSDISGNQKVALSSSMRTDLNRFLENHNYQVRVVGKSVEIAINGNEIILLKAKMKQYFRPISLETHDVENCRNNGNYDQNPIGENLLDNGLKQRVYFLIQYLPPIQRKVLVLLYGLWGCTPGSYAEVARQLQRTEQRIRQLEKEALATLRAKIRSQVNFY